MAASSWKHCVLDYNVSVKICSFKAHLQSITADGASVGRSGTHIAAWELLSSPTCWSEADCPSMTTTKAAVCLTLSLNSFPLVVVGPGIPVLLCQAEEILVFTLLASELFINSDFEDFFFFSETHKKRWADPHFW